MAVTTVKIFPSIGIARLGNSPTGFFVGPELPGDRTPPAGGYKDASCRIKRQAARFRLFGYDASGGLVGEITQSDARIVWTVHLANTKAAARQFAGSDPKAPLRNSGPLPGVSPIADRSTLSIDPGPRSLSGANQSAECDAGTFLDSPVPLGEIRTGPSPWEPGPPPSLGGLRWRPNCRAGISPARATRLRDPLSPGCSVLCPRAALARRALLVCPRR